MAISRGLIFVLFYGIFKLKGIVPESDMDDDMAMVYLKQYNYMGSGHPDSVMHNDSMYPEALMMYQMMSGLNQTGELDAATKVMMQAPRCGVPDILSRGDLMKKRRRRYVVHGGKWSGGKISYSYDAHVPTKGGLSRMKVHQIIDKAFQTWASVTNLYFTKLDHGGDIQISFVSRDHGDNIDLDGPGKVLAHAFFPAPGPFAGDVHLDDEETWTEDESTSHANLFYVALHELGHSLGLKHSMFMDSIMHYSYPKTPQQIKLTSDDIKGITRIYGHKQRLLFPRPTPKPAQDTPQLRQRFCDAGRVNAIGTLDGKLYAFQDDLYAELDKNGIRPGYPRRTTEDWENFPENPDAALALKEHKILLIFKDDMYFRYTSENMSFSLAVGYPRLISDDFRRGLPAKVDAAFEWRQNGHIYVISDGQYYRIRDNFKVTSTKIIAKHDRWYNSSPKDFSSTWNIPSDVDDATSYRGRTFFFSSKNYYRYNDNKYRPDASYPRDSSESWFGCTRQGSAESIVMEMDMMETQSGFEEMDSVLIDAKDGAVTVQPMLSCLLMALAPTLLTVTVHLTSSNCFE